MMGNTTSIDIKRIFVSLSDGEIGRELFCTLYRCLRPKYGRKKPKSSSSETPTVEEQVIEFALPSEIASLALGVAIMKKSIEEAKNAA
jgi:hypothetical protein